MTAYHPAAQRQCCVSCDILVGCNGNCSSSSASCNLITHCKADRYFHQLHLSSGKSASFPLVHTQPVQKKYTVERPGALSWALSLWWDSVLLKPFEASSEWQAIKTNDPNVVSHSHYDLQSRRGYNEYNDTRRCLFHSDVGLCLLCMP